jgi:hypothetical protein
MADSSPITLLPTTVTDPVAAPLRDVAALFADELSDVRFPDLDAKILNAAIAEVEAAVADVAQLEAAVADARRRLDERHDALVHKAARGLAYARVFADNDAELLSRLDSITLPRARRGASAPATTTEQAPKKRGRKPQSSGETLFAGPSNTSSGASISQLPTEATESADATDDSDVAHAAE